MLLLLRLDSRERIMHAMLVRHQVSRYFLPHNNSDPQTFCSGAKLEPSQLWTALLWGRYRAAASRSVGWPTPR